jgi:ubiquinone/menaquinone biosynthesis C-methylase UbiE
MKEKAYNLDPGKLRTKERLENLEPERAAGLCLEGVSIRSVLDVGTGTGVFAEEFYRLNLSVTGTDISPEMINTAKEFIPNGNFKLGKAEELPFEDKSFDLVFMGLVFHELDEQLKTLQEAKRAAVKEVAILEWQFIDEESGPPLNHRLSEEYVIKMAEQAGLVKPEVIPLKKLVLYKFLL